MSGADKTEKPTPRRIQRAREQGQVAKSMDLNGAVVMGTASMLLIFAGAYAYDTIYTTTQHLLSQSYKAPLTIDGFAVLWQEGLTIIILLLAPFALAVTTMGVAVNLAQVKPLFTTKPLIPKWEKLNVFKGAKRLFSMRSIVETLKSILKMAIVGLCAYLIIQAHLTEILGFSDMAIPTSIGLIVDIISQIAMLTVVIFLLLGGADLRYQIYELEKSLKMTKQEVRDERKDLEGDPQIKAKVRQMGQQMARKRQLAAVPTADVVVTNPTHFAVAIKYDPDKYPAPHVVAKGADNFAFKIREVAKANGVPIRENKPLARSLFSSVDADQMIPPEFFVAVAEVLAWVFSKKKGRKLPGRNKPGQGPERGGGSD